MTEEEKQRLRQLIANVDSVTCAKVWRRVTPPPGEKSEADFTSHL